MSEWRPDPSGLPRRTWVPDPGGVPTTRGPAGEATSPAGAPGAAYPPGAPSPAGSAPGAIPTPLGATAPGGTPSGATSPGGGLPAGDASPDLASDDAPPEGSRRARRAGPEPRRSGPLSWLRETVIVLVSALVLSLLVKTFLVQAFWIPSQSMHDTLIEDDRILVNKLVPGPFDLHRGDIVVFKDPGNWLKGAAAVPETTGQHVVNDVLTFIGLRPVDAGQHLVKRVIGLPGDRVACAGPGQPVTVNGVPLDEPYLAPGATPSSIAFDITVPADSLWVMGDNRDHSEDSRYHQGNPGGGSVPTKNVVGVAFVTVWPADRWTVLHNPGATFAQVPDPA